MLRAGARVVCSRVQGSSKDAMRGTQHLLTQEGRQKLVDHYGNAFGGGAQAVTTHLNTSVEFLDQCEFWEDCSRDNDLSYYEVGGGTHARGYAIQSRGYKHCVPRRLVSPGEKSEFSQLLMQLAVAAARQGRDATAAASEGQMIGATAYYTGDDNCLAKQLTAAASEGPDFFAIEGCATAADVQRVVGVLEANKRREVFRLSVNKKGFTIPDETPSIVGFDIPVLLMAAVPPCNEEFKSIAAVVSSAPQIACLGAPTVVEQADRDALLPQLNGKSLAGASEAAGEMAIH